MLNKLKNNSILFCKDNYHKLNNLLFEDEKKKNIFHNSIRKSPIRQILDILIKLNKNKKYYDITVFISVFVQFPIFSYLYNLDTNFNNNVVYSEIIDKLNILSDEKNNIMNQDWRGLYNAIIKKGYISDNNL